MKAPGSSATTFDDEGLLALLTQNSQLQFSRASLKKISAALAKVPRVKSLDYEILRKALECLRSWCFSRDVFATVPVLVEVYDNLLHRDYGRPEVLDSICELLFLIEDMADQDEECKVIAGKDFLARLLSLAGAKVTSVRLQRAAVETLSSLIAMCPCNQRFVSEKLTSECGKLVKQVLPSCGDFFVQASIAEIFYRLSKKHPQLLDLLEDKTAREKMRSLQKNKKPDLLGEIRAFLDHLNQSFGRSRSVYSFLAEDIVFDGRCTPLKQEKWVHLGMDHISCYGAPDSLSNRTCLVDVYYNKVTGLQRCSESSMEIYVQGYLGCMLSAQDTSKTTKICLHFKPEELSIVMDHILPRINHLNKQPHMIISHESNSENTSATPGNSTMSERGFLKASVGFVVPLPKRCKLMAQPENFQDQKMLQSRKAFQDHKINPGVSKNQKQNYKQTSSPSPPCSRLCDQTCETLLPVQEQNLKTPKQISLPGPGSRPLAHENIRKPSSKLSDKKNGTIVSSQQKDALLPKPQIGGPGMKANGGNEYSNSKQNETSCSEPKSDCKNKSLNDKSQAAKDTGADISKGQQPSPENEVTSQKSGSSPCTTPRNQGHSNSVLNKTATESLLVVDKGRAFCEITPEKGTKKMQELSMLEIETEAFKTETSEAFKTEKTNEGEKVARKFASTNLQPSNIKVKKENASTSTDNKVPEIKQNEQLRDKILRILRKVNMPKSDVDYKEKQKLSTSDPIETDSERTCKTPVTMNQSVKKSKKAPPKRYRKSGNHCLELPAVVQTVQAGHQEETKTTNMACMKEAFHDDVYCFDADKPGTPIGRIERKGYTNGSHRKRGLETSTPSNRCHNGFTQTGAAATLKAVPESKEANDNLTDFENVFSFEKPYCSRRRRKEPRIDIRMKERSISPTPALGKSMNAGHRFCILNRTASPNLDEPINNAEENEDKMPTSFFHREEKNKRPPGFTATKSRANRASIPQAVCTPIPFQKAEMIAESIFGVNGEAVQTNEDTLLPGSDRAININDDDLLADGAMQLLATLIGNFTRKVKVEADRKSAQILACTMETIQNRYQEVQGQIQQEIDESLKSSKKRFGQLQAQLQDEHEKLKDTQQKWKDEFNSHVHRFNEISSQVETTHSYLKGLSDKQRLAQRHLLANYNEFTEQHLADAEKKLLILEKTAKSIRTQVKGALLEFL